MKMQPGELSSLFPLFLKLLTMKKEQIIITPAHPIIECFILAYHSFDIRILSFNYKLN